MADERPWTLGQAVDAAHRAREEHAGDAQPVVVVDVRLPLGAVFGLWLQVAIIQLAVAAVIVAALFLFGVF